MGSFLRWLRNNGLMIYAGFAIFYMLVPIIIIAVLSFGETESGKLTYAFDGFTTEYWESAFSVTELNDAMITSLQLAAATTVIATILGTLMAMALVRHQFAGRRAANLLIVLPMATPEIVIGASLLSMFTIFSAPFGFTTLLLAHVMFSISFVVVVVRSRLIGFDRSLEEAAQDLGATSWTTFRTVTFPLLRPGIVAGGLLAFVLSLDDFVISNFNSGSTLTFPLYIYGVALRGVPVQVNVLATLLFVVTVAAIALVIWQQRRADRLVQARSEAEVDTAMPAPAGSAI